MTVVRLLNVFPERGDFIVKAEWDRKRRFFRIYWRESQKKWYLDLRDSDRSPMCLGVCLVPDSSILEGRGLDISPGAGIAVIGQDYDSPLALGDTVNVVLFEPE